MQGGRGRAREGGLGPAGLWARETRDVQSGQGMKAVFREGPRRKSPENKSSIRH